MICRCLAASNSQDNLREVPFQIASSSLFYSVNSQSGPTSVATCVCLQRDPPRQRLIYRRHDDHFHSQRSPLIIHKVSRGKRTTDWARLQQPAGTCSGCLLSSGRKTNSRLLLPPAKEVSEHFVSLNGPNKLPGSTFLRFSILN